MGAVARKIHEPLSSARTTPSEEAIVGGKLPQRSQVMEIAALTVAAPGSVAMAIATCLAVTWGANGGDLLAWSLLVAAWIAYPLLTFGLIAATLAER